MTAAMFADIIYCATFGAGIIVIPLLVRAVLEFVCLFFVEESNDE